MTAIYGITDESGAIINRIVATEEFCEVAYPGRWVFIEDIIDIPSNEPDLSEKPKEPVLWATAQMTLEGGVLTSILANWNWKIAGCFQIETGVYYVFFTESLTDTDYIAKAWDGNFSCFVRRDDQFEDSFIVNVKDVNGNPADPSTLNVEIIKST
jgi:hypothetical protein